MDLIDIEIGPRLYRDVSAPTRFGERFRGMRAECGAMVFAGCSVHGLGLGRPLTVVAVDRGGLVSTVRPLLPGRILFVPGARWLLELESELPRPAVGERARFYDRRDGGTTRGVCHADREPGGRLCPAGRHAPRR